MNNCWFCYKDCGEGHYHTICAKKFFGTPDVPHLDLDEEIIKSLANKIVNKRIAITGVQPKLSVTLQKNKGHHRLTIVGLWGEFILKPQHNGYPMMPETEDLTMHIAELFKIQVCKHALLQASNGSMVYIAKRFDREGGKKIHIEDLCQLSEFLTENKYKSSYEKAGNLIAQYCHKGLDLINYFELVLFSYLCGNNDMHLKNFSVMHQPHGVVLCPAYDLLNVNLVNPKDKEEMALTLNGKKAKLKRTDFEALAINLGINEKACSNILNLFSSKNREVIDLIDRSFLNKKMKKGYKEIWMSKQKMFG